MAGPSYMLEQPPSPSAAKRYLDRRIIPIAIDAAGGLESVVERVATRVRRSPGRAVCVAFGLGVLLAQAGRFRPAREPV